MRNWIIGFVLVAVVALAACTRTPDTPQPTQEALPPIEVTVSADEGAVTGKVVSTAGGGETPLGNTTVWLAYVEWAEDGRNGAFYVDGAASPSTITRSDGSFVIQGLEARDYVIVVGDLYGRHFVPTNPDGSARIYVVNAGEVLDIGALKVDLAAGPPPTATVPTRLPGYPAQPTRAQQPGAYP